MSDQRALPVQKTGDMRPTGDAVLSLLDVGIASSPIESSSSFARSSSLRR
jgi:hypothetical protein